jgi:hypothetical protein
VKTRFRPTGIGLFRIARIIARPMHSRQTVCHPETAFEEMKAQAILAETSLPRSRLLARNSFRVPRFALSDRPANIDNRLTKAAYCENLFQLFGQVNDHARLLPCEPRRNRMNRPAIGTEPHTGRGLTYGRVKDRRRRLSERDRWRSSCLPCCWRTTLACRRVLCPYRAVRSR